MESFASKKQLPSKVSIRPNQPDVAVSRKGIKRTPSEERGPSSLSRESSSDYDMRDSTQGLAVSGIDAPQPPSLGPQPSSSFSSVSSSFGLPPVPPPSPSGSFNGVGYVPPPNAASMAQSNPSLILEGFIQRFREIDHQYQLSIPRGLERQGSYDLGGFTPYSPDSQESLPGSQSPGGVYGVPSSLERAASAASAASGVSVATSISEFARSLPEISQADLTAAGISQADLTASGISPEEAVANLEDIAQAEIMKAAIDRTDQHIARAEEISRLKSAVSGAASVANDEQNALLRVPGNQRLLDNIDAEFDALTRDILNSTIAEVASRSCLFIIRRLNNLFGLIIRAIGAGLGFAIKYPKLALILMCLAYLQSSTCAFIINKTIKFVWWITSYLFGMTTAGQKIGQFIEGIVAVYNWLSVNGVNTFEQFMAKLNYLVELAENIQANMDALKAIADSLKIDLADLVQIILSMRDMFGSSTPGVRQTMWNMIGHFASGAGSGATQALLGNGAGPGGFARLQPGGGKRKSKTKTNKKRKSKSNKKGKTKTRRR